MDKYAIDPQLKNAKTLVFLLTDKESPCLFYIHGGGIDYGLSPKHPFPYARNQCFETCKNLLKHVKELKVDPNNIIIAGDSSGGLLALKPT